MDVLADPDRLINVLGDTLKVLPAEAAGRHSGRPDADAARGQGRLIARDGVLVAGDVDLFEDSFNTGAIERMLTEVDEDHMRVGAVGDELMAKGLELILEGLGVRDDIVLTSLELGGLRLLERDGEGGDSVVVRTTLMTGEDGEVDGVL